MLNKKIEKALNKQINHEFHTTYSYLGIATWFASQNLPGFAHWMNVQSAEERTHALKFIGIVEDRGGRVELEAVGRPQSDFRTAKDAIATALKLEQATTALINALYSLAVEEKDYATQSALKWFVDEQVEEEKSVGEVLAKMQMAGDSKGTLLMLDHQAAKRGKS